MGAMASDQFISEPVEVTFHEPPALEKTPPCPAAFTWREERHVIAELLAESHSFERRGKMSRNMRPTNLAVAASRGSWGVGRFSFRIRTEDDRYFELYYDRAPTGRQRKGGWYLYREFANRPDLS